MDVWTDDLIDQIYIYTYVCMYSNKIFFFFLFQEFYTISGILCQKTLNHAGGYYYLSKKIKI